MALALGVSLVVAVALMFDVIAPVALERWKRFRARRRRSEAFLIPDPGRERRAEQKARELLRSCVNAEEWSMYRELGFMRVWSRQRADTSGGGEIAYLIYPHRPVVSFNAATGLPLHEYCVVFPDEADAGGSSRLPDSDDALAKWMALTGDESGFVAHANLHGAGRQVPLDRIRADIWRLSRWEGSRLRAAARQRAAHQPLIND